MGVDLVDREVVLRGAAAEWEAGGPPGAVLTQVVTAALAGSSRVSLRRLAAGYYALVEELQARGSPPLLRHEARDLVSSAIEFEDLATSGLASASRLAGLFGGASRPAFTWRNIKLVLEAIDRYRSLSSALVSATWKADGEAAPVSFVDADYAESVDLVADLAVRLGYAGDPRRDLSALHPGSTARGPLLAMLYFQCLIVDQFDHPVADISEFGPRTLLANQFFDRLRERIEFPGNPFLNNAKGTVSLDRNWAVSRSANEHGLVRVLEGLEGIPFAARRELASVVRQWMLHLAQVFEPPRSTLDPLSLRAARRLANGIARQQTNTLGILEQRLVDALTSLRHPSPTWLSRGLGAAVNASNTSTRRLGDCDYQDPATWTAVAYEAHAGRLTAAYVAEHARTMRPSLTSRRAEWSLSSDPDKWSIRLVFVAHEFAPGLAASLPADGEDIAVEYVSFDELVRNARRFGAGFADAINDYVVTPLNRPSVPTRVRQKADSLAGA
jgi:hypothetical protein